MLEVLTPAGRYELVTVSEAKVYLGVAGTADDANIALQISAASEAISTFCGRTFQVETVRETFWGARGAEQLSLSRWPVSQIVSVREDGTLLVAADYQNDSRKGLLRRLSGDGAIAWGNKVVVEYSAGFVNIPAGLREACFLAVQAMRESLNREVGTKSERVEGFSQITYFGIQAEGLPAEVVARLQPYQDSPL
jgi:hypothetical protein